jgi:hypothetical protein
MTEMQPRLSREELEAEAGTALPNKEVMSLLDLNADINAALDLAAPVDLAVAANANVAAPIDAAVSSNALSPDSLAQGLSEQVTSVTQHLSGDAVAHAPQTAGVDQADAGGTDAGTPATTDQPDASTSSGDSDLLNVNVNVDLDGKVAAPIDGAVAANANIAAPIDASVASNVGSIHSEATALAHQTAVINQDIDGATADATAAQGADVTQ